MKFLGKEIQKSDMPSFKWQEDNADHIYLSMQDVHKKNRLTVPTQTVTNYSNDENNDMQSRDARSSVWK